MITFLQSLPIGNAARVLLSPPAGAGRVRVLRKVTDDITAWNDATAGVVYDGDETYFVDQTSLINDRVYYYKPFYLVGASWVTDESLSVTIAATARAIGPDPLSLLRERLEVGLKAEVVAARLHHEKGFIPCLTAPPAFEGTVFPVVTMKLSTDATQVRALGDLVAVDVFHDGVWTESEGALFRVSIEVGAWVVNNADVRIALRQAIKKVIVGNFPLFAANGLSEVNFSFSDVEDLESYGTPMFQTVGHFDCLAPFAVEDDVNPVSDVTVQVDVAA